MGIIKSFEFPIFNNMFYVYNNNKKKLLKLN